MSKNMNSIRNQPREELSWPAIRPFLAPEPATQAAAEDLSGTDSNTASELKRSSDIKPAIEKLLEILVDSTGASSGLARVLPLHSQTHQIFSSIGLPDELLALGSSLHLDCETCAAIPMSSQIVTSDLKSCETRHLCANKNCRIEWMISAPIESRPKTEDTIGTLTLFFDKEQKDLEQLTRAIHQFTDLLSMLIEQYRLNREVKRRELMAERQSMANEIHDSLAQTLVFTRMRNNLLRESIKGRNELMMTKYAHEIDDALEECQKSVRELITDYRCGLDPAGLLHALQTHVEHFRERTSITLQYVNKIANFELPLEYEIQISHIIQEALANIATHSDATHARLTIDNSSNFYMFTIEDDGVGGCTFTPIEGHYGMLIMRERAKKIGGEIKLESVQGIGTSVRLFFPEPGLNWREINE
jgi:two-component system nitrate/nitrite sensor histidine kinase NarX